MNIGATEDDSALVGSCINRDLPAWAQLVKKYTPLISISIDNRLKRYGFRLSAEDVGDIRQSVLAEIWEDNKLATIKNRSDISYWLAVVSGNIAMEYMRKKRRIEPVKVVSIFEKIGEKQLADIMASPGVDPAEALDRIDAAQKIEAALEKLPDREKIIFKLNLFYGKRYEEIADMLDIPKGTVASYVKRAKERLRKKLKNLQ